MRKTVIALILLLPLLFIFVVFSSTSVVSLGILISVNGIQIVEKPANNTLSVDLATYNDDYVLTAEVTPAKANNKKYSYRVEQVQGSDFADIDIDSNGKISAKTPGLAKVSVVSNDGGFTDSITMVVGSSKALDFEFMLKDFVTKNEVEFVGEQTFSTNINTGKYSYAVKTNPVGFLGADVQVLSGNAYIDTASATILFPFSGEVSLKATLPDGLNGNIEKIYNFNVSKTQTQSGFTINGGSGNALTLDKNAKNATFYVECDKELSFANDENIEDVSTRQIAPNMWEVEVKFASTHEQNVKLGVVAEDEEEIITFSFNEFNFSLRAELPLQSDDFATIYDNQAFKFYAVPSMEADGITYTWNVEEQIEGVKLSANTDGSVCEIKADEPCEFKVVVQAFRNGKPLDINTAEMNVTVVKQMTSLFFDQSQLNGLAKTLVVGGLIADGKTESENLFKLDLNAYNGSSLVDDINSLEFSLSNDNAEIVVQDGKAYLKVLGKGEVDVCATWKGNNSFASNVQAVITLDVDNDAVEVDTSEEIFYQAGKGNAVVLGKDIMLGTDTAGKPLSLQDRQSMVGKMKSTFNIEYYKNTGKEDSAYVNYVLEFKNDVYGNGHKLNAEYFTHAVDGSNVPQIFRGPLHFVNMGAYVAGQDNIAFLVRTKGVTLYNVDLLGCSDESLNSENVYDLSMLNNVGTTLEINADAKILNCRIRNGRNVVRVYGGNTDGNHYFVESLEGYTGCKDERINVTIDGCIISHGREFLLKIGANKALKATTDVEPSLTDAEGNEYSWQTNENLKNQDFYDRFVMTDVTLKDSVLEKSGLFTVGIESNFAGNLLSAEPMLALPGWGGTGGTSFATVLNLVGDVRLYDWKEIRLLDSSTLIEMEADTDLQGFDLKLDIRKMIKTVCLTDAEKFGNIIKTDEGKEYVHGGIAFYGGGKNYSQINMEKLDAARKDFEEYFINVSVLQNSDDQSTQQQGTILPLAAGTQDFRFYMYSSDSSNSLEKQLEADNLGTKYEGIKSVNIF